MCVQTSTCELSWDVGPVWFRTRQKLSTVLYYEAAVQGAITQNMYRCVLLKLFSEMHRIEGLKIVLYQISIENNKKNLVMLKKRFLTIFERIFLFLISPRDG